MEHNNLAIRREVVKQARQVIVKAGTRLLTSQEAIAELVEGIDALRRHGFVSVRERPDGPMAGPDRLFIEAKRGN